MTGRRGFRKPKTTAYRHVSPRRIASPYGQQHVTLRDYEVMAVLFGFADAEDMRDFAADQQVRADSRQRRVTG